MYEQRAQRTLVGRAALRRAVGERLGRHAAHQHDGGPVDVIVAGGLSDANVRGALEAVGTDGLLGVDASSGLELNGGKPGQKDLSRVRAYVEAAITTAGGTAP